MLAPPPEHEKPPYLREKRLVCLPCFWCACTLGHIFENEGKKFDVCIVPYSGINENDNQSGKFARLNFDRGDSEGIDIVARRESSGRPSRLPDYRRVNGRDTKSRIARQAQRQRRNHYSDYRRVTARSIVNSTEGTFRVHNIYGDGNCMFRAVSYVRWGDEGGHRILRSLVTNHITNNWEEYEPFVIAEWGIDSPQEYRRFMSRDGTYATELECTVATKLYKMSLAIYRRTKNFGYVERVFHNRVNGSNGIARLLFSGRAESGHYNVLLPENNYYGR